MSTLRSEPLLPVVAVLLAAVLHASWNALLKPRTDGLALLVAGSAVLSVACVLAALLLPIPARAAWPALAASAVTHVGYDVLLLRSYRHGAFNQVYPLARGTGPLLVALVAALVLGERMSPVALAGVAGVCTGVYLLAGRARRGEGKAVLFALATGVAIATYTLFDGIGVRHAGTALGYAAWLFALTGPLALVAVRPSLRVEAPGLALAVATLSVLAYGLVLWAQQHGALAAVAALRESSVVVAALIGARVFGERLGTRRIVASVVVLAGVMLLAAG